MCVCVCVQFHDYNHALAYNHKFWTFFLPCGNVKAHYTEMYRVQFVQSGIAISQIKSKVNRYKKRTKGEIRHCPITVITSSTKPRGKDPYKQEASQTTKVASLLPSMPNQRLHNGVIALVQHLNNKRPKNASRWKADQIDLTTILIVSECDKNTTKIFNLSQHPPFSAYDMANRASENLNTMKTVMVFIKPSLCTGVIEAPPLF